MHIDPREKSQTEIEGLVLRKLTSEDASDMFRMVQDNTDHLIAHGDYKDLVSASLEDIERQLKMPSGSELQFGMASQGSLVGAASLIQYKPHIFGLGYWVSQDHTGRGFATAACRSLISLASTQFEAREIWAGIRASNDPSRAVAERIGMKIVRRQETHLSYMMEV